METRAYAVKRYLFRLGHAARSARYATTVGQLVIGLAPIIGWGTVPRDPVERARFVRAHRRSVQRWLDDLQAAGVVAHEPERDGGGSWWRTQIVLLRAPAPAALELELARQRARGWAARERGRRGRARRAPSLGAVRGRSGVPSRRVRGRLARGRVFAAHEARRRAAAEAQIAEAQRVRECRRDLAHPFGAPPTSALPLAAEKTGRSCEALEVEGSAAWQSVRPVEVDESVVVETGARGRAAPAGDAPARAWSTAGIEELARLSPAELDAVVSERIAAREWAAAWRTEAIRVQASARVAAVLAWPAGRSCPLGRLREAWVAHRYGLARVADSGTALAGWPRPGLAASVARAIELYEAHAGHRPPGWPSTGTAALCALASQQRADRFAGDLARLELLAKGMRAAALEHDGNRITRARMRAERRRKPRPGRLAIPFRLPAGRFESAEVRRCRVRDAVLLAGGDPATWPNAELAVRHLGLPEVRLVQPDRFEELDGIGARATRYRAELNRGHWPAPPPLLTSPDHTFNNRQMGAPT